MRVQTFLLCKKNQLAVYLPELFAMWFFLSFGLCFFRIVNMMSILMNGDFLAPLGVTQPSFILIRANLGA